MLFVVRGVSLDQIGEFRSSEREKKSGDNLAICFLNC